MRLTKSKEFNKGYRIFYKHGAWYGYAKYNPLTGLSLIRRYNDNLTTFGYLENGFVKKFYI